MPCSKLEILGYRGFSTKQQLELAIPDGVTPGSGLTILVGPNNSGKSTIMEAFRALGSGTPPSFTEGRRNKKAGDRIELCVTGKSGTKRIVKSVMPGSSETIITSDGAQMLQERIFSLPARRVFQPYFGKASLTRSIYLQQDRVPPMRSQFDERYAYRLFEALAHIEEYNALLGRILQPPPVWTIDQSDNGQYYVKLISGELSHSSEGMGEGLVSLLLIADALYDSMPDDVIVIDEPELSLHPSLQRRLSFVLRDYARDRQIVCATHSPHFVDFDAIADGAKLARVCREENKSAIHQLGESSRDAVRCFLSDLNNPHMLGLDAREVFFLDDCVILVEGQEDVIFYPKIAHQLGVSVSGEFYGWGTGGAGNMARFAQILSELGFKKVFGILDGNKKDQIAGLSAKFPGFGFGAIDADDVRTKPARDALKAVDGLATAGGMLKPEHKEDAARIFGKISDYMNA